MALCGAVTSRGQKNTALTVSGDANSSPRKEARKSIRETLWLQIGAALLRDDGSTRAGIMPFSTLSRVLTAYS